MALLQTLEGVLAAKRGTFNISISHYHGKINMFTENYKLS